MIKLKEIIKSLLTAIHNIHFKKYVVKYKVNQINCNMLNRTDDLRCIFTAKRELIYILKRQLNIFFQ